MKESIVYREGEEWRKDAACQGVNTQVFFESGRHADKSKAREICSTCPVRKVCLDYSIANGYEGGIWGGLDEEERRRIAKQGPKIRKSMNSMVKDSK